MRKPKPGERYRHFKGKEYQIVGVATHTETEEPMVVYQALYGSYGLFVRPLAMFLEQVDAEKYPEYAGQPRFAKIAPEEDEDDFFPENTDRAATAAVGTVTASAGGKQSESTSNIIMQPEGLGNSTNAPADSQALLMEFLDLDNAKDRLELLQSAKDLLNDHVIDSMAAALDVQVPDGVLEERIVSLERCLATVARFETGRMR